MIYNKITHNRPQKNWVKKSTKFLWLTIDSWLFTTQNALPSKVLSKSQGFILVGMHGTLATLTSLSLVFSKTFVKELVFIMATTTWTIKLSNVLSLCCQLLASFPLGVHRDTPWGLQIELPCILVHTNQNSNKLHDITTTSSFQTHVPSTIANI